MCSTPDEDVEIFSEQFRKIPFSTLINGTSIDYEIINNLTKKLLEFTKNPIFDQNVNDCILITLEFAVNQACLFLKNQDGEEVLLKLIKLINITLEKLRLNPSLHNFLSFDRILVLINNFFQNSHFYNVQLQACYILGEIVSFPSLDKNHIESVYYAFKRFESELKATAILARISKQLFLKNVKLDFISNWILGKLPPDLNYPSEALLQLLESACSLLTVSKHLNDTKTCLNLINKFKPFFNKLCLFLNQQELRESSEMILSHVLSVLSSETFSDWPENESIVLREIKNLPTNIKMWIHKPEIFFISAYLQELHSKMIWSNEEVLEAINLYLKRLERPSNMILKSLLLLYPAAIKDNCIGQHYGGVLTNFLETTRNLSSVITNHPSEIIWLLKEANTYLKLRILTTWLEIETNEMKIIEIIEEANCSMFLIQVLIYFPNETAVPKIANLLTNLKEQDVLKKVVHKAFPLICKNLQIFGNLLQIQPTIPNDPTETLNLLRIISASLPFFDCNKSIVGACCYAFHLLLSVKNNSNALSVFYQQGVTIRFLVQELSVSDDEEISINAVKLLNLFVKIQMTTNFEAGTHPVDILKMIQGSTAKIQSGLRFLRMITAANNMFKIPKKNYLEIYHYLHLHLGSEVSEEAFKTLRYLLKIKKELAASLVTSFTLRSIFRIVAFEKRTEMNKFLMVWLECLIIFPFAPLPKNEIKCWIYLQSKNDRNYLQGLLNKRLD